MLKDLKDRMHLVALPQVQILLFVQNFPFSILLFPISSDYLLFEWQLTELADAEEQSISAASHQYLGLRFVGQLV